MENDVAHLTVCVSGVQDGARRRLAFCAAGSGSGHRHKDLARTIVILQDLECAPRLEREEKHAAVHRGSGDDTAVGAQPNQPRVGVVLGVLEPSDLLHGEARAFALRHVQPIQRTRVGLGSCSARAMPARALSPWVSAAAAAARGGVAGTGPHRCRRWRPRRGVPRRG